MFIVVQDSKMNQIACDEVINYVDIDKAMVHVKLRPWHKGL